jgi:hypothetical protein
MPSMTLACCPGSDPGRDRIIELVGTSSGAVVDLGRTLTILLMDPDDFEHRPHDWSTLIGRRCRPRGWDVLRQPRRVEDLL